MAEDMRELAKRWGKSLRRRRLRMMLFSGIEFKDLKEVTKCSPIKVM